MKRFRFILAALLLLSVLPLPAQETHLFAERDTCNLYLDIWRPAEGSETAIDGVQKPAILFVFGGGFISGNRRDKWNLPWFRKMQEDGYTVISIDYRLGMKSVEVGKSLPALYQSSKDFYMAQQMGVEDLFSAVSFLAENRDRLGIDPDNIVVSGSSAGAIISMAAVHDISCGLTAGLPEGFSFKGVMSFAGAIVSITGEPRFGKAPCPMLLLHGTADKAVAYKHFGTIARGIWGSDWIARQCRKNGWDCCIWRFQDRTHDVAAYMEVLWDTEKDFIEKNVMKGVHRSMDSLVDDPSLPTFSFSISMKDIYN